MLHDHVIAHNPTYLNVKSNQPLSSKLSKMGSSQSSHATNDIQSSSGLKKSSLLTESVRGRKSIVTKGSPHGLTASLVSVHSEYIQHEDDEHLDVTAVESFHSDDGHLHEHFAEDYYSDTESESSDEEGKSKDGVLEASMIELCVTYDWFCR